MVSASSAVTLAVCLYPPDEPSNLQAHLNAQSQADADPDVTAHAPADIDHSQHSNALIVYEASRQSCLKRYSQVSLPEESIVKVLAHHSQAWTPTQRAAAVGEHYPSTRLLYN